MEERRVRFLLKKAKKAKEDAKIAVIIAILFSLIASIAHLCQNNEIAISASLIAAIAFTIWFELLCEHDAIIKKIYEHEKDI